MTMEVSHVGNVETDQVDCIDSPQASTAMTNSFAAKNNTIVTKKADSTEVGNYAKNLSSTVESKTSASEHCNAQETGISDDK